jgi:hypothetical protein
MRKESNFILMFVGVLMLLYTGPVWAERPQIELTLDKPIYFVGEPVGLTVTVSYAEGNPPVLITKGFQDTVYYLELRVIDPAGKLLLAKRQEEHIESPDAPPLAFVYYNNRFIRVADCEVLEPGEEGFYIESRSDDIRQYYDIGTPGPYSVQVQIAAIIFSGEQCDIKNYEFKGILKSETKYFTLLSDAYGPQIVPSQWSTKWIQEDKKVKEVQIHLRPGDGEETSDYQLESIRLNGIKPLRTEGLQKIIKAYFDGKELMQSLGSVQVGQMHVVYISGSRTVEGTVKPFLMTQQIRIVN